MKKLLFVETPMNVTTCFLSIHSIKIQRNTGNLVEIHSTKFSKEISLNEKQAFVALTRPRYRQTR